MLDHSDAHICLLFRVLVAQIRLSAASRNNTCTSATNTTARHANGRANTRSEHAGDCIVPFCSLMPNFPSFQLLLEP
jgi:hypothetical protein